MHRRHFACPFDFFLRGVRLCDSQVILDALVEEIGRLRDHRHIVQKIIRVDFIDINAVVVDFTLVFLPKAEQEF